MSVGSDAIAGLVLAAGEGRRFGGRKQLAELDGRPLLQHALDALADSRLDRRIVVLGADAAAILDAVDLRGADAVVCERWERGQGLSLAAGVARAAASGAAGVVITLGDQPHVPGPAIDSVAEAMRERSCRGAARASYAGLPGHPVGVGRDLFERFTRLSDDEGGRSVLSSVDVVEVPCDGLGSAADVDTEADLETLRRGEQRKPPVVSEPR